MARLFSVLILRVRWSHALITSYLSLKKGLLQFVMSFYRCFEMPRKHWQLSADYKGIPMFSLIRWAISVYWHLPEKWGWGGWGSRDIVALCKLHFVLSCTELVSATTFAVVILKFVVVNYVVIQSRHYSCKLCLSTLFVSSTQPAIYRE